jgi:hypothetical protein
MGTVSPPPGGLRPEVKKTGAEWPAIALVAVLAVLILTAARGYLKSEKKPPAPVVQPTAAPAPTLVPTPVPTEDTEKDLRVAEAYLLMHLKSPSSYRRISSREVWTATDGIRFRIEYDAQNSYGALMRECSYVPFPPPDPPHEVAGTPCSVGDALGWNR